MQHPFRNVSPFAIALIVGVVWRGELLFSQQDLQPEVSADPTVPESESTGSWWVQTFDGKPFGRQRTTQAIEKDTAGRAVIVTVQEGFTRFQRLGSVNQFFHRLEVREAPNGDLLAFEWELDEVDRPKRVIAGRWIGDDFQTTATVGETVSTRTWNWEQSLKSPLYAERFVETQRGPLPPVTKFRSLMVSVLRPVSVEVRSLPPKNEEPHTQRAEVVVTDVAMPKVTLELRKGRITRMLTAPFLGGTAITERVDSERQLPKITGAKFDVLTETLVKVPPLRLGHRSRAVTYRIRLPLANPKTLLPTGGTQRVKVIDEHTAEVKVTALRPSKSTPAMTAAPEYLRANAYLESDRPEVRSLAEEAVGDATDPAEQSRLMEAFVHRIIREKNFSTAFASAAQVAISREGDCTEHAVLLAAMLRAKRIPSRVVIGLVYLPGRNAFGTHMWTEAGLGESWVPLDATMGRGGIGAGHIKLTQSSLDGEETPTPAELFLPLMTVIGNIEITVLTEN